MWIIRENCHHIKGKILQNNYIKVKQILKHFGKKKIVAIFYTNAVLHI